MYINFAGGERLRWSEPPAVAGADQGYEQRGGRDQPPATAGGSDLITLQFFPDQDVPRLAQQQRAHDEGYPGNRNWVVQTRIDVSGLRNYRQPEQWQQPAKHAVADVIG